MPIGSKTGTLTATGDTTRTTLSTITLPPNAKKIIGLSVQVVGAAAITTAEPVTGIAEFTFSGLTNGPPSLEVLLDVVVCLTSGTAAFSPRVWVVEYSPAGSVIVECFITMDMAQTGGLKARFQVIYEY